MAKKASEPNPGRGARRGSTQRSRARAKPPPPTLRPPSGDQREGDSDRRVNPPSSPEWLDGGFTRRLSNGTPRRSKQAYVERSKPPCARDCKRAGWEDPAGGPGRAVSGLRAPTAGRTDRPRPPTHPHGQHVRMVGAHPGRRPRRRTAWAARGRRAPAIEKTTKCEHAARGPTDRPGASGRVGSDRGTRPPPLGARPGRSSRGRGQTTGGIRRAGPVEIGRSCLLWRFLRDVTIPRVCVRGRLYPEES